MASNTDFDILTNRMANLNILEFFDSNRGGKLMKYKNYVYKKVKVKDIDGIYQMVSVHILKNGKNLPLCYAFLPRKTEAVYDAFFAWLDLSIENKPLSFSIDFEMAIMNSVQNIWPETILKGCYFHFRQNLFILLNTFPKQSNLNQP